MRVLADIPVAVDYGQIFVMVPSAPSAGLLWSDDDVDQGFAWAPGIMALGVIDPDDQCLIRVELVEKHTQTPDALAAIRVPFTVGEGELVEIGTVGVPHDVALPPGHYAVLYEPLPGRVIDGEAYTYILRVAFGPAVEPDFAILKQGFGIKTDKVLSKLAEYA